MIYKTFNMKSVTRKKLYIRGHMTRTDKKGVNSLPQLLAICILTPSVKLGDKSTETTGTTHRKRREDCH